MYYFQIQFMIAFQIGKQIDVLFIELKNIFENLCINITKHQDLFRPKNFLFYLYYIFNS